MKPVKKDMLVNIEIDVHLLNTNLTHHFQEPMCADDRVVQHEY